MLDILILILINSALCFGFWNACYYEVKEGVLQAGSSTDYIQEKEEVKGILWRLEKWGQGKWYYKPIGGCVSCMASFHSIYPYWTYMYFTDNISLGAIMFYPIYIIALSGVNYLIDRQ